MRVKKAQNQTSILFTRDALLSRQVENKRKEKVIIDKLRIRKLSKSKLKQNMISHQLECLLLKIIITVNAGKDMKKEHLYSVSGNIN